MATLNRAAAVGWLERLTNCAAGPFDIGRDTVPGLICDWRDAQAAVSAAQNENNSAAEAAAMARRQLATQKLTARGARNAAALLRREREADRAVRTMTGAHAHDFGDAELAVARIEAQAATRAVDRLLDPGAVAEDEAEEARLAAPVDDKAAP